MVQTAVSKIISPGVAQNARAFAVCVWTLEWLIFTYFNGDCIIIGEI